MHASQTITLSRTRLSDDRPDEVELVIPRTLGSVTLTREIGRGGMGVVWLGRDGMLERDVAVKFLLSAVTSADDPRFTTFLDGSKAAAAVRHVNLTSVLHAGLIEGIPYIVMEYVGGPSLSQVLRGGAPLCVPAALAAIEGACLGTGELHTHEIIHRDLKPGNIMLSGDAGIFVTDFGLAVSRQAGSGAVRTGVAGSPSYMAPEMFSGEVSPKTDVYALGITLFELLTGDVPFGGTIEDLEKLQRHAPIPTEKLAERKVHAELIEVIERAVHKNALFRYRSAEHMLNAVRQACPRADQWSRGKIELSQLVAQHFGRPATTDEKRDEESSGLSYYDTIGSRAAQRRQEVDTTRSTLEQERFEAEERRKAEDRRISEAIEKRREEERKRREASGVGIPIQAAPQQQASATATTQNVVSLGAVNARCQQCGYVLRGILNEPGAGVCPECGTAFDPKKPWIPEAWPSTPKLLLLVSWPAVSVVAGFATLAAMPVDLFPFWLVWWVGFAFTVVVVPVTMSKKLTNARLPVAERAAKRRWLCLAGIGINLFFWAGLVLLIALLS